MKYDFVNKKYSEEDIRKYIEKYYKKLKPWTLCNISKYQTLSEQFIRDFQDLVWWGCISEYQNLSEEFLIEFIEKINIYWLKFNEKIPEDVKNRIANLKKLLESA